LGFSLQIPSEPFLILSGIYRDHIKNVCQSSCKVFIILARFLWKTDFLNRFLENTQISNFMKIRPKGSWVVPCGQPDRQTWRGSYNQVSAAAMTSASGRKMPTFQFFFQSGRA